MASRLKKIGLLVGLLVLCGVCYFYLLNRHPAQKSDSSEPGAEPPARAENAKQGQSPGARSEEQRRRPGGKRARRLAGARARQELLGRISRALAARERQEGSVPSGQTGGGASPESSDKGSGHLEAEYIKEVINEAIPLVQECYELALHETPDAEGKMIIEFTIVGDEEEGGLVEEAKLDEDSPLARHQTFSDCMKETILSLEFDKPEGGGRVKVRYPFKFKSAPPAEEAAGGQVQN